MKAVACARSSSTSTTRRHRRVLPHDPGRFRFGRAYALRHAPGYRGHVAVAYLSGGRDHRLGEPDHRWPRVRIHGRRADEPPSSADRGFAGTSRTLSPARIRNGTTRRTSSCARVACRLRIRTVMRSRFGPRHRRTARRRQSRRSRTTSMLCWPSFVHRAGLLNDLPTCDWESSSDTVNHQQL